MSLDLVHRLRERQAAELRKEKLALIARKAQNLADEALDLGETGAHALLVNVAARLTRVVREEEPTT